MAIEAAFMEDVRLRLQLKSCGRLLKFSTWPELASDIGLPGRAQAVKSAVFWLERSSTGPVKHWSPDERKSEGGDELEHKHSLQVPLSADQQKVLDRLKAARDGRLSVIINGGRREVLAEQFGVDDAVTIIDAFVMRGRLDKVVTEDRKLTETYRMIS